VIEQGTDYSFSIVCTDVTNVPLDLTAYTYMAELRRSYYSTTGVSFAVSSPVPSAGELTLALTPTQTAALKPGRYVYDVLIVAGNGAPTRVLEGIVTVTPQVSRITTTSTTTTTTAAPTTTTTTAGP
jgi:hypothetical protein